MTCKQRKGEELPGWWAWIDELTVMLVTGWAVVAGVGVAVVDGGGQLLRRRRRSSSVPLSFIFVCFSLSLLLLLFDFMLCWCLCLTSSRLCSSVLIHLLLSLSFSVSHFFLFCSHLCFSQVYPLFFAFSQFIVPSFFFSILSLFKTSVNFPLSLFSSPFPSVPSRFFLFFLSPCLVPLCPLPGVPLTVLLPPAFIGQRPCVGNCQLDNVCRGMTAVTYAP